MNTAEIKTSRGTVVVGWITDENDAWASARLDGREIAFNALATGVEFVWNEDTKFSDDEISAITAALVECWDENNEY